MGEALGKVANLATPGEVVFLGEQPEWAAQCQKSLEELLRLGHSAGKGVVVGQPEAAGQERTLRAWQAVDLVLGLVPEHEPVAQQGPLDRPHGALDPGILWRQEAYVRNQQHAGIE